MKTSSTTKNPNWNPNSLNLSPYHFSRRIEEELQNLAQQDSEESNLIDSLISDLGLLTPGDKRWALKVKTLSDLVADDSESYEDLSLINPDQEADFDRDIDLDNEFVQEQIDLISSHTEED